MSANSVIKERILARRYEGFAGDMSVIYHGQEVTWGVTESLTLKSVKNGAQSMIIQNVA